jgi:hypothetical protein
MLTLTTRGLSPRTIHIFYALWRHSKTRIIKQLYLKTAPPHYYTEHLTINFFACFYGNIMGNIYYF